MMQHRTGCPCERCKDHEMEQMRKANTGIPILQTSESEMMELLARGPNVCSECLEENNNLKLMDYPSKKFGIRLIGFLCRKCVLDIVFPNDLDKEKAYRQALKRNSERRNKEHLKYER